MILMVKCYTNYYYSIEKAPRQTERSARGFGFGLGGHLHSYPEHGEKGEDREGFLHDVCAVPRTHIFERSRIVVRDDPAPAHQDEGDTRCPGVCPHPLEQLDPCHF